LEGGITVRQAKRYKGFSLVELIIAITVLMIIMGSVALLTQRMSNASADQRRLQSQNFFEEQARMALLSMVRDVRMSNGTLGMTTNSLTLNVAYGATLGTVQYGWSPIPAGMAVGHYVSDGDVLLTRVVAPPALEALWEIRNPFTPSIISSFEPSGGDGRIGLRVNLQLANLDGTGFRPWYVPSAVSYRRIPD
jgi:type II secretory pathway pseudopilin PulG